ncbi:uncharacterized protein LOC102799598 [Neolamprologus brichardi]|uniref:uncharacterized protein LOC102799598 n=1 Tax=Neolamprologus brichardi TaxID=32507 RepID=UPI0003EBDED4|nr:uncharacterized protein LOC102799598 [Neolamprologus brichardi]
MSFAVMVALLFCSETLGSHPVFGEEDVVESDFDISNRTELDLTEAKDWSAVDFSDYGSEYEFGMEGDIPEEADELFYYPLSPVNLIVDSMFNSSYSCNLTVTCSTYNFNINSTFKCNNKTCHQEGGEQRETWWWSVSLHVYMSDGSIICNYSNEVNWTKDMIEIGHFCPRNVGSESFSDGVSFCMVKTVVFSVGLIIMVFAVITVHLIEKFQMQN